MAFDETPYLAASSAAVSFVLVALCLKMWMACSGFNLARPGSTKGRECTKVSRSRAWDSWFAGLSFSPVVLSSMQLEDPDLQAVLQLKILTWRQGICEAMSNRLGEAGAL